MIRCYDFISAVRDPLAENTTIASWCSTKYSRRQIVSVGWDYKTKPKPTAEHCPAIVLRPVADLGGQGQGTHTIRVAVNLALWESRAKDDAPSGTRTPEMWWVENMKDFAEYVWAGIKAGLTSAGVRWHVNSVTTDYKDDAFPLIEALMILEISVIVTIGDSEPTLT